MSGVRRIFVEKKPGFDVEAKHLLAELREYLGLTGLTGLRRWIRYDIEGLDEAEFAATRGTVFSEPNADDACDERIDVPGWLLAVAFLPGQYDQRADSAAQCAELITQTGRPAIACATVYAFEGTLSQADRAAIRRHLINPVESCEVSFDKPETLSSQAPVPDGIARLDGFRAMTDDQIAAKRDADGMAMTARDLCFVRDHFIKEGRDPSVSELRVIDTYWSDHCRHTTFHTRLTDVSFEPSPLCAPIAKAFGEYLSVRAGLYGAPRDVSLMDLAVIGMRELRRQGKLADLDASDEINACSIVVPANINGRQEEWLVMFKNETHNHPTEIEPFGGAATCLGGAIRDPLSGRSFVYQAMRITGAAEVLTPPDQTLPGKLPQRVISRKAAAGYSSYGNQIGLATGIVQEYTHPGFLAKRMELGAVIGAAPRANVRREQPTPGDIVLLVGGRTGRDGCGGATGSSRAHTADSLLTCGAEVQKGNPIIERAIQRLMRNPAATRLIKRCNDFGAGGVCVAIGELADGLAIDLDAVPKKYDGLDGTELAISESQERMAILMAPSSVDAFIACCNAENLEATRVATVTAEPRLRMTWRGDAIVDLPRSFLDTNGVTGEAAARVSAPDENASPFECIPAGLASDEGVLKDAPPPSLSVLWLRNLQLPGVRGQRGLIERFDATVGAATVLHPFGGSTQGCPAELMAALLPAGDAHTTTCTLMSHGYMPDLAAWSPFHGAAWAIVAALSKIAAVGGHPLSARLSLQEYFERMTEDPTRWGKPLVALLGALTAQLALGVAAIGGKDSMSGSFHDINVPPTLVAFAVAANEVSELITPELKAPGHTLALLPCPRTRDAMPDWAALKANWAALKGWIDSGAVISARTVGEGGIAAALTMMALGNRIGVRLLREERLFQPDLGGIVLELADGRLASSHDALIPLGFTLENPVIEWSGGSLLLEDAATAWEAPISAIYPLAHEVSGEAPVLTHAQRSMQKPAVRVAKPRVVIPVYLGTNGEYDAQRAFSLAGATPQLVVVRNRTPEDIADSIAELADAVSQAQIMYFSGGFSAGDEPDGSGKFIAATLRNPRLADAIMGLLGRDGLILGICNGFQALVKVGLVPYGEIRDTAPDAPTLTFNAIGRHVARFVTTRTASVRSPWLAGIEAGDVHTIPVSHGEGRFVATQAQLEAMAAAGQIAFQYAAASGPAYGMPTMASPDNPNGSVWGIEGVTSPDGRVLGKMGHSERIAFGDHLALNIPGNKEQRLFASGVAYFS